MTYMALPLILPHFGLVHETGDIPNEIGVLVSHHSLFGTIWLQDNYLTGAILVDM